MIRYLDTSAIAKSGPSTNGTRKALRTALSSWSADELVSSQLMATELHRVSDAARRSAGRSGRLSIRIDRTGAEDFVVAGLGARYCEDLDVLHVAVALRIGADVIVTYDRRQAEVADAAGLEVLAPERPAADDRNSSVRCMVGRHRH